MHRAVPWLLLAAIAGCGGGHSRPRANVTHATDECFEKRDRLRAAAPQSRELAKLESSCRRRAEQLIQQALARFQTRDVEGGRSLLDRAIALAAPGSPERARADAMRKRLDAANLTAERDYMREGRDAEAAADWPAAREAYRAAVDSGKAIPGALERLAVAEQACVREARRALAEARSFETARDLDGALDAIDRALAHLDDPQADEYREAEDAQTRLQALIEAQVDDGIDEPPDDDLPVLDFAAAEDAEHRLDWTAARNAYRAVLAERPDDTRIHEALRRTQEECLVVARREIVMAKAFEAALNYGEAAKMLASAMRCADAPHLAEAAEARRVLERIRAHHLPSPSLLALPSDRDELLRLAEKRANAQDWLTAREAFRRAADAQPGDADVTERLRFVNEACLRRARRFLWEAKAYEAAANHPEALKAVRQTLLYADAPESKEYQQARELEQRLHTQMAYP